MKLYKQLFYSVAKLSASMSVPLSGAEDIFKIIK